MTRDDLIRNPRKGGEVIRINALSFAKLMRCIMDGPSTISDAQEETGMHYVTTRRYLKALHRERVIHVCGWEPDVRGRPVIIVYALGDKPDVARKRLSHTQRQQAYRNRKKLRLLELRG